MKTKLNLRNKRGANTAEYVVLMVLVVLGSVGVVSLFGTTVRNQIGRVNAAISGESEKYAGMKKRVQDSGKKAEAADVNMAGPDTAEAFPKVGEGDAGGAGGN